MFFLAFFSMIAAVALSNYLVQFPINDWLTFGAFSYPITFLITELTNRFYGSRAARCVVYGGFALAMVLSLWLATPKIAIASGSAFLISQLLDIFAFNKWRNGTWWQAPLFASTFASIIDTPIFWSCAFWGEHLPILTWALGDFCVKLIMDFLLLTPFRLAIKHFHIKQLN